jgi:mitochondrial chaperone BCS1
MALALATEFELPVFKVDMSAEWMSNDVLKNLFDSLPEKGMVLMEDIDSAGIQRENMQMQPLPPPYYGPAAAGIPGPPVDYRNGYVPYVPQRVSLQTLLNVLDGIGASEGRVVIMTSNHIDRLDPAWIRAGRVDGKYELSTVTKSIARRMFARLMTWPTNGDADIQQMAQRFADHFTDRPGCNNSADQS